MFDLQSVSLLKADVVALMWTVGTSYNGYRLVLGIAGFWLMRKPPSPLEAIYSEIETALRARLWYAAIVIAAALPDICSTLEGAERTRWDTYKGWFDRNAASKFGAFSSHECYELRCGVMHNGVFQGAVDKRSRFSGVFFTPPGSNMTLHDVVIKGYKGQPGEYLFMGVVEFCRAMIDAVQDWETANTDNEEVRINMEKIVRLRPNGLPPFVDGAPIIA